MSYLSIHPLLTRGWPAPFSAISCQTKHLLVNSSCDPCRRNVRVCTLVHLFFWNQKKLKHLTFLQDLYMQLILWCSDKQFSQSYNHQGTIFANMLPYCGQRIHGNSFSFSLSLFLISSQKPHGPCKALLMNTHSTRVNGDRRKIWFFLV